MFGRKITGRKVKCSCCSETFSHGVTRVKRFVVFHFCAPCTRDRRSECDAIMEEVSKLDTTRAVAAAG
jgi:hypothetical protein